MNKGSAVLRGLPRAGLVLAFLLALGCASAPSIGPEVPGVSIEGKVSLGGAGASGARVLLYGLDSPEPLKARPIAEAETGADGAFRLAAPEGSYLLVARQADRFAYFGRNPLHLFSPQQGLNLPLAPAHPVSRNPAPADPPTLALEGRVLLGGKPVAGAQVFAYVGIAGGLRGPGYAASEPTGPDGAYRLSLPPGTYFLAARVRHQDAAVGPMQPGDLFGVSAELPLAVRQGEALRADIELVELPGRERMARFRGGFPRLTGAVVDDQGRPVSGLRVCLYESPNMLNQPAAVSEPTGSDGLFTLDTRLAGTFYLGARESLGGPPAPGERIGFLLTPPDGRVDLTPGAKIDGLRIVVRLVP